MIGNGHDLQKKGQTKFGSSFLKLKSKDGVKQFTGHWSDDLDNSSFRDLVSSAF
jgi:hypothetical protein